MILILIGRVFVYKLTIDKKKISNKNGNKKLSLDINQRYSVTQSTMEKNEPI